MKLMETSLRRESGSDSTGETRCNGSSSPELGDADTGASALGRGEVGPANTAAAQHASIATDAASSALNTLRSFPAHKPQPHVSLQPRLVPVRQSPPGAGPFQGVYGIPVRVGRAK